MRNSSLNYDTSSITSTANANTMPSVLTFGTSFPNETLSLTPGSQEYFFSAITPARNITYTSWSPDFTMLGNSWAAKCMDVSIGHQKNNVGNYSTTASNHQISGVGVSNFTSYSTYNASIRSFNSTQSFNLTFKADSTSLVLIMIAGGGIGSINITSGISLNKLYDVTYSTGAQVNASADAYKGIVSKGEFTVTINSTMNAQINSGTGGVVGAVAYVFSSTSSSGTSDIELYAIIGAVVAVAVIGSVFAVMRKRR